MSRQLSLTGYSIESSKILLSCDFAYVNCTKELDDDVDANAMATLPGGGGLSAESIHQVCRGKPSGRQRIAARLLETAGVAMIHLIDHWVLPDTDETVARLIESGFEETLTCDGDAVWSRPGARLARVRLNRTADYPRMAIAVENIDEFAAAWSLPEVGRRGDTDSGLEETRYPLPAGELTLVVRIAYNGFRPGELNASSLRRIISVRQHLRSRARHSNVSENIGEANRLLTSIISEIGQDRTVDELFSAEREFYVARNAAATHQYRVQRELGIGWANQDHHTYRSSRQGFRPLMELWRILGFEARERYYAGDEAGWGAQIMEHPSSRVVLFSDVDIAPDELDIDFSAVDLAPRQSLGTIGLWCALHGDSIGLAGMHHLECEYDFDAACAGQKAAGFGVMPPFTDLPMLKQAFTVGEIWPVAAERVEALRAYGLITNEQAAKFTEHGATGSHLEILQRWEGFKGFNKTGVSAIIRATDARV